jgi:hypothetical protein
VTDQAVSERWFFGVEWWNEPGPIAGADRKLTENAPLADPRMVGPERRRLSKPQCPQIHPIPLTNNTAARKACALLASRKARAFGRLGAACVRYCADLGCPRITPRFIQNAPRDSILSRSGVRFERDTPRQECSNCERRVLSLMRTLYYVNAGSSWFGFYLDEGALALANDGARFNSFGAVLAWAGEHDFEFVAKCEPEGSARVAPEMRRNGGRI